MSVVITWCRRCSFNPSCQTQKEMRSRHGYPNQMMREIMQAHVDGFVTIDKAQAGIKRYQEDYNAAPPEL